MGSLWGHIDEGMFFMGLALWWIFNMFRDFVKGKYVSGYKSGASYTTVIGRRDIPIETFVKMFVIFGGFMIEVVAAKWSFVDENGEFKSVTNLQHMSIYMLFMFHVVIDLLQFYNLLNIRGLDYLSAVLAFFWYGTVFFFHSFNNDLLEKLIHCIGIVLCYGTATGLLWEYCATDAFLPNYIRNLLILSLGTWFTHTPFFLFSTEGFPGSNVNERWKRDSMMNFEFAATMLGFHLLVNMCLTLAIYLLVRLCYRRSSPVHKGTTNGSFKLLRTIEKDEENGRLLDSEDEEM